MTNFRAVTESGTVWEAHGSHIRIEPKHKSAYTFRGGLLKTLDRQEAQAQMDAHGISFWEYLDTLPAVELPVVGLSIFAAGFDEWRLSTPVVSVETLEEEHVQE